MSSNLASLKKEFAQLSRTANSRIDSLKKGRYRSPAVEKLKESGIKRFGVKAQNLKTEADYRKAIRQAKNFLSAETSTRKGLKNVTRKMMENFGIKKKGGESLSSVTRKSKKLFDLYDDLKEMHNKGDIESGDKYELMELMSQLYDSGEINSRTSASEIVDKLNNMIKNKRNMGRMRQSQLNFNWSV